MMTAGPYARSTVKQIVDRLAAGARDLPRLYRQSRLRRATAGIARQYQGSHLKGAVAWIGSAVRNALLFRWLTAEPDADVVVIDLRETWTVGPILAVLEWLLARTASSWVVAGASAGGRRLARSFERGPVQVVGLVVLIAVVTNALVGLALGSMGRQGVGLRLIVAAGAIVAMRVDTSLAELRDSKVGDALRAIFEPPEPPGEE